MALEAVVYPQPQDPSFGYAYCKEMYSLLAGGEAAAAASAVAWGYDDDMCLREEDQKPAAGVDQGGLLHANYNNNWDQSSSSPSMIHRQSSWGPNSYDTPHRSLSGGSSFPPSSSTTATEVSAAASRRKRRRTRSSKNKEDLENQRMTHIAVERNRRKQMNEYLSILRSLMPPSYAQRGDQASIVGGSINFVKELEHMLQSMEAQRRKNTNNSTHPAAIPFAEFFTFPQYSTSTNDNNFNDVAADIEVNMAESHANIKILTQKQPRQLLKMMASFQNLRLTVLHLNVSTVGHMVIYSVSVKVEEGSHMNTGDEIAAAVNQILTKIEEEAGRML